jgi:hypothetical protein
MAMNRKMVSNQTGCAEYGVNLARRTCQPPADSRVGGMGGQYITIDIIHAEIKSIVLSINKRITVAACAGDVGGVSHLVAA